MDVRCPCVKTDCLTDYFRDSDVRFLGERERERERAMEKEGAKERRETEVEMEGKRDREGGRETESV